jgi:hypothetical protein
MNPFANLFVNQLRVGSLLSMNDVRTQQYSLNTLGAYLSSELTAIAQSITDVQTQITLMQERTTTTTSVTGPTLRQEGYLETVLELPRAGVWLMTARVMNNNSQTGRMYYLLGTNVVPWVETLKESNQSFTTVTITTTDSTVLKFIVEGSSNYATTVVSATRIA